jgi:glycosyltransferase involved in cell wall biosynthesis
MTAKPGPSDTVTVIIPCYKQARLLSEAVESALGQTEPPSEVIVVDDGSPDDTASVAATFGDRIRYLRQANAGVCAARNTGLAASTGRFVVFLDADDVLAANFVERSLAALEAQPEGTIACSGWRAVTTSGRVLFERAPVEWRADAFHQLLSGNVAPPCCWLVPRATLDRVGAFDSALSTSHEDWDVWLRASAAGVKFVPTHGATALYRVHGESASQDRFRMFRGKVIALDRCRSVHSDCALCRRAMTRTLLGARLRFLYDLAQGVVRSRSSADLASVLRDVRKAARYDPLFPLRLLSDFVVAGWRRIVQGPFPVSGSG